MRYTKTNLAIVCTIMLYGCGMIKLNNELNIDQKINIVHDAAEGGVAIMLQNLYPDSEKRLKETQRIKNFVDHTVINGVLSSNPAAAVEVAQGVFDDMPMEYSMYLKNALNLLSMYIETPDVSEVVSNNNYRLVLALFSGISDGCQSVINYENAQ